MDLDNNFTKTRYPRRMTLMMTLLMSLPFLHMACNVYQSSGRKSFESKVGESQVSGRSLTNDCWSQPADEALWQIAGTEKLEVTRLDDQKIQVCIVDDSSLENKNTFSYSE